jgi:hypothetical protein
MKKRQHLLRAQKPISPEGWPFVPEVAGPGNLHLINGTLRLSSQSGTQAKDRGNFDDPANWYTLCLPMIHIKVLHP